MWYKGPSKIHGVGAFASKDIPKGTRVAEVAVANFVRLYRMTEFGALVNHQTNSNSELQMHWNKCFWLYTLTDVAANSEFVVDYKKCPQPPFKQATDGFVEN